MRIQGFPVVNITRLLKKGSYQSGKVSIPLIAVELQNTEDKQIFTLINTLSNLFYCTVTVEPLRRSKDISKCTRCQRFGHTKHYCKLPPSCVKCL